MSPTLMARIKAWREGRGPSWGEGGIESPFGLLCEAEEALIELQKPASPPLDDAGYALLEELRINANRLCDRQLGGTYEQDCRRTLRKVDDYQKAAYLAGRGVQRAVVPAQQKEQR